MAHMTTLDAFNFSTPKVSATALTLEELGLERDSPWVSALSSADGLLVVGGHGGSGRGTTIASSLKHLEQEFARLPSDIAAGKKAVVVAELHTEADLTSALAAAKAGHLVLGTIGCSGPLHSAMQKLQSLGLSKTDQRTVVRAVLAQSLHPKTNFSDDFLKIMKGLATEVNGRVLITDCFTPGSSLEFVAA